MIQRYFRSFGSKQIIKYNVINNYLMASLPFKSSRTVLNYQMRKQLSVIDESSQESIEEQKIWLDMKMVR